MFTGGVPESFLWCCEKKLEVTWQEKLGEWMTKVFLGVGWSIQM